MLFYPDGHGTARLPNVDSAALQKTPFFIVTAVKTSNLTRNVLI
jgi:hypothetical protein